MVFGHDLKAWQGKDIDALAKSGSLFKAIGRVQMPGAMIGGSVICDGAHFGVVDDRSQAIQMHSARIGGDIRMRLAVVNGETRMFGVQVQGRLRCHSGTFTDGRRGERFGTGMALMLEAANIGGDVVFAKLTSEDFSDQSDYAKRVLDRRLDAGFHITGQVKLKEVKVGGDLRFEGGKLETTSAPDPSGGAALGEQKFSGKQDIPFSAEGAQIQGSLIWKDLVWTRTGSNVGIIDLSGLSAGQLDDAETGWPEGNDRFCFGLNGFSYGALASYENPGSGFRVRWLSQQAEGDHNTQPFSHLARLYLNAGYVHYYEEITIGQQKNLLRSGRLDRKERALKRVLGMIAGYGFRPLNTAIAISLLIFLGGIGAVFVKYEGMFYPIKIREFVNVDAYQHCDMLKREVIRQRIPKRFTEYFGFSGHKICNSRKPLEISKTKGGGKVAWLVDREENIRVVLDGSRFDVYRYFDERQEIDELRSSGTIPFGNAIEVKSIGNENVVMQPRFERIPGSYPGLKPFLYAIDVFIPFLDLRQEEFWEISGDATFLRIGFFGYVTLGWFLTTLWVVSLTALVRRE